MTQPLPQWNFVYGTGHEWRPVVSCELWSEWTLLCPLGFSTFITTVPLFFLMSWSFPTYNNSFNPLLYFHSKKNYVLQWQVKKILFHLGMANTYSQFNLLFYLQEVLKSHIQSTYFKALSKINITKKNKNKNENDHFVARRHFCLYHTTCMSFSALSFKSPAKFDIQF